MRENIREMSKRVKKRLKGTMALLLAIVLAMTMLPGAQAKAINYYKLKTGDAFYFVVYEAEGVFGAARETIAGDVFAPLEDKGDNRYDNGIIKYYSGIDSVDYQKFYNILNFGYGGATSYVMTDHDATVYCGNVKSDDNHVIQMLLDGTNEGANTGAGSANKGSFILPAGKYKVKFGTWSGSKYIINFETIIESITISPNPLNITTADDPYPLQVKPVAAQTKVTWKSSDENVAKVDGEGKVTPVGIGKAEITATYTEEDKAQISATCIVNVAKGEINTDVEQDDTAPQVSQVTGLDADLANSVLNAEEKAMVGAGKKTSLTLEMTNKDGQVASEEKNLAENTLKKVRSGATVGMYFDMSLILRIGSDYQRSVSEMGNKSISVELDVPASLRAPSGVTRTFYVVHIHKGVAKNIASTKSTKLKLSLNELSTFALAYADGEDGFYSGLKVSQKNGKLKISWDKTDGVANYKVFATYCGSKYPKKAVKTTKKNSVTVKKIKGDKIDFSKNFKLYVVAYDNSGNVIGKTVKAHVAGKDNKEYKNPKKIKLSNKNISLNAGQTSKIKASVKMEAGNKKALTDDHVEKLRYRSTNENIAKVDKKGKITAVGTGTCQIYVYAKNGLAEKATVTVN